MNIKESRKAEISDPNIIVEYDRKYDRKGVHEWHESMNSRYKFSIILRIFHIL